MENFIVSARKYRPDIFDSVVGQESITRTLKNAIRSNHLAHAYLFCGPRGVGKTTCARIFARTINCMNLTDQTEACNECESCQSFKETRSYNIHELDAASNNSVDDIRTIIDQVRIPPQVGKYSIYIIDEVHMLSAQAFNAFLKTLEEPPAHAIFILATTEKHKIIPTILSRCQIFDFSRIQINDIVNYLERISKSEVVTYERDAFNIIAQKADGGMRDALSIYDQIVSCCGNSITYKDVIDNLNVLDYDYYFTLVENFISNNIGQTLLTYNDIINNGFDSRNFMVGLSSHFRDLLVARDAVTLQLLEVGENIRERYLHQTAESSEEFLLSGLEILSKADVTYGMSRNKRLHVEIALIQLCSITALKKKSEPEHLIVNPNLCNAVPAVAPAASTPAVARTQSAAQAPSVRTVQVPTPVATRTISPMPSISIKDALKGTKPLVSKELEVVIEVDTCKTGLISENSFTPEQLADAWMEYANKLKTDQPRMSMTLLARKPELKGNWEVEFSVDNHLQAESLTKSKPELLHHLKSNLNNESILLNVVVREDSATPSNKLYTAEDKLNHLIKKNPALDKLRQQFNLDFD